MLNVKQGSCEYQFCIVFGLTDSLFIVFFGFWMEQNKLKLTEIELVSTVTIADALSTRLPIV